MLLANITCTSIWIYSNRQNKAKEDILTLSQKALDRLCKKEKKWTHMFDSDTRVGLALLDEIRKLNTHKPKQR